MVKRRASKYSPYIGSAKRIMRKAYRYASKVTPLLASGYSRSGTTLSPGRKYKETSPTSNQYDVKTWYRRKKTNLRRMYREKKSYKDYVKNKNKTLGSNYFSKTYVTSLSPATNAQLSYSTLLMAGGSQPTINDLYPIMGDFFSAPDNKVSKVTIESGVLDLQLTVPTDAPNTALVTVYTIRCKKDCPSAVAANPVDLFNKINTYNTTAGILTTRNAGVPYVTPFTSPDLTNYFVINKVTKLILSPGQTSSLQTRVSRDIIYDGLDLLSKSFFRNKSVGYLVVVHGVTDGINESTATSLNIHMNKTFNVRVDDVVQTTQDVF